MLTVSVKTCDWKLKNVVLLFDICETFYIYTLHELLILGWLCKKIWVATGIRVQRIRAGLVREPTERVVFCVRATWDLCEELVLCVGRWKGSWRGLCFAHEQRETCVRNWFWVELIFNSKRTIQCHALHLMLYECHFPNCTSDGFYTVDWGGAYNTNLLTTLNMY